jgi:methylated-DNA-[protein]-cysteine S-methyltransferase
MRETSMHHALGIYNAIIDAPFGKVGISTGAGVVRQISYLPAGTPDKAPGDALSRRAVKQIERYLTRAASSFDLPIEIVGSAFQQRVWQAIAEIPCGTVATYGQIARRIGSAPRAVGQACGANYFPLLIPCHRVVSSSGIGGFSNHDGDGYFREIKRWLLAHEGVVFA